MEVAPTITLPQGHESLRSLEVGYNPLGPEGTRTLVNTVKFDLKVTQPWGLLCELFH